MDKGFEERIGAAIGGPLRALAITTLQANIGYCCPMACLHCHFDAGPKRMEMMSRATMDAVLDRLQREDIPTLDITGGSPEMNPHFVYFIREAKKAGRHVIVRTNLTILGDERFAHLPAFFSSQDIEITASLPHYRKDPVDQVRGEGVFVKSITMLKKFNRLGYGSGREGKTLNLVYNPPGSILAPDQKTLEKDYRRELAEGYGISFDRLFVFTNMPIGRFKSVLERGGNYTAYMAALMQAFNPATINGLMCRHLVSVGWNGAIHDCDFNQALGLTVGSSYPQHIREFSGDRLRSREVRVGNHCYGCTAGQGST